MNTVIYMIHYHPTNDNTDSPRQETLTIHCHHFPSLSFDTFPSIDDIIGHAYHIVPSTSLNTFFDSFFIESIHVLPIEHIDATPVLHFRAVSKDVKWNSLGDTYRVFVDKNNKITRVSIEYDRAYDSTTSTLTFSEPLPLEIGGFGTKICLNSFVPIARIHSIPMRITGNMLVEAFICSESLFDISGLTNWDVSGATSMEGTFRFCKMLSDLSPIAGWDTSNVTNMDEMFNRCESLSSTSYLSKWNVSHVTSMICTFSVTGITNLDGLTNWDVSNVVSMDHMFARIEAMDINALADWNVSNVTSMDYMFAEAKLTDIDGVSRWDVRKVKSARGMFCECMMESLDALREWKPIALMWLCEMFEGCVELNDISALGEWPPTSTLRDLRRMFKGCMKIHDATSLSKWDVSNVECVDDMLDGCDLYEDDLYAVLNKWDLYTIDQGWRSIASWRSRRSK